MPKLAVIGGSSLRDLNRFDVVERVTPETRFGSPSGPLLVGNFADQEVVFLARHGEGGVIPPHRINYRANLSALGDLGVQTIVAVAAVGGITEHMHPRRIAIPDQIIDYTSGREHSFYGGESGELEHVDFTWPFSKKVRTQLIRAANTLMLSAVETGTYGVTQGPRLETAAEITRLQADGCDLVGMTAMPEAGLARELGIDYGLCTVVVNWAAGRDDGLITMDDIRANVAASTAEVLALLALVIPELSRG